jgi:signal transduction histidine kinase
LKFGGGKTVGIVVESAGDDARIRVMDHGIGIAPENLERIFERFQRAGSTTNYGGFGLGLWIVRELVTAMRGSVRVESAVGRGTTFVVELPRWS